METPVITFEGVSVMQSFWLCSSGFGVFGYKIGVSSPFILMREQSPSLPFFMNPDYVAHQRWQLTQSTAPKLRLIHPAGGAVLGFAGKHFPFAYGLWLFWRRTFDQSFVLPTCAGRWLAYGVLGVGILMGVLGRMNR
ncbi:MAG: hypothetical protein IPL35_15000 [Sphingobacteriales bacterium]|nr:hypothetical protein [Sphingobacteriales bacterium]